MIPNYKVVEEKKEYVLVLIHAHIRNNETNEIRVYQTREPLYIGAKHPNVFNWEENNYSCDCNRRIFFESSIGSELVDDFPCSDGKYSVNLVNPITNEIYYKEYEN